MLQKHFTYFLGCIGASNRALVIISIGEVLFLVLLCFHWDTYFIFSGSGLLLLNGTISSIRLAVAVGAIAVVIRRGE